MKGRISSSRPALPSATLHSAVHSVVITDPGGNVIWSNPAFTSLTGYAEEEITGQNLRVLKSGKHEPAFYAQLWQTIVAGDIWRGEMINRRRDGSYFIQEQTITPLRDPGGRIGHFLSIQQDITERKRTEVALLRNMRDRRRVQALEREAAVERERARVARDMHDSLGSNLTRIKLLSERIERDAVNPEKVIGHARLISRLSRELAVSMDEIVWAVDPSKDRLEHLGSYLAAYAEEFLGCAELRFRFDFPDAFPDLPLSAPVRYSVFLAVKEALTNSVRHAQASEVRVGLKVLNGVLELEISDNGRGLCLDKLRARRRCGLRNMQTRLAEVGGACHIESAANTGTKVRITAPCGPLAHSPGAQPEGITGLGNALSPRQPGR